MYLLTFESITIIIIKLKIILLKKLVQREIRLIKNNIVEHEEFNRRAFLSFPLGSA